jgi:hypothetical protein
MRSSIFNSSSAALIYVKRLCWICGLVIVLLEGGSAYLLNHRSVTYRRVANQLAEAVAARPGDLRQPASVVMMGNSLLLDGVQTEKLRQLTSSRMQIYPVFLEGTGYYDWLFALRRIFRQGARPNAVVVELETNSFLWNQVRMEYAPILFFDAADLWQVGLDVGMDRTARSNLLLSHWSAFWNTHGVVRLQILRHAVPYFEDLFTLIPVQRNALLQTERTTTINSDARALAAERFRTLNELCNSYGARLVMLAPPVPSSEGTVRELASIGLKNGVAVVVPIDPEALTADHYEPDALHLNPDGAAAFTSAIARVASEFL